MQNITAKDRRAYAWLELPVSWEDRAVFDSWCREGNFCRSLGGLVLEQQIHLEYQKCSRSRGLLILVIRLASLHQEDSDVLTEHL